MYHAEAGWHPLHAIVDNPCTGFTRLDFAGFPHLLPSAPALCCVPRNRLGLPVIQPRWALLGWVAEESLPQSALYSRRATPSAEADDRVYAFWYCNGRGDLSRVRNLSLGGIFIETYLQKDLGSSVELYFLASEGQIRAKAVVRHAEPSHGLGLKLTAINDQDRLRFAALMKRLYSAQCAVRELDRLSAGSAGIAASLRPSGPTA